MRFEKQTWEVSVFKPIPVAAWPKALVCGCSLGLRVRISPTAWMFVLSAVCCQVEVSESGWSLIQRSPTECGVSECDNEASIMRPWMLCHGKNECLFRRIKNCVFHQILLERVKGESNGRGV